MIYLPNKNYACYVVRDKDTIRAYHTMPSYNTSVTYTDYYINSHYLENIGEQQFNQYSNLPLCIDKINITDLPYYRNDINDILVTFGILLLCLLIPVYISLKALFRGVFR